jgi:hypothetical protein
MYFESNKIKVFPCQRRDNNYDRASLLNTEFNLTNMINRLTDVKSFIINGLTLDNFILKNGECNIGGYYFNISNDIENIELEGSSINDKLILEITLENDSSKVPYGDELLGADEGTDNTFYYKGLNLRVAAESENIKNDNTHLILAD